MKTSLRDHAQKIAGSAALRMTKQDQADMVTGLRRQALSSIYNVTISGNPNKAEKYDRIEQIMEGLANDIRSIIATPTVD